MGSNTSSGCIAWYKNKIIRGIIKVNKDKCNWLKNKKVKEKEITLINMDEVNLENEAERYVYNIEKKRTGKYPKKSPQNSYLGYDLDSGDRHIEVKSRKRGIMAWITLTPNESEKLIKNPKYWLYLVEGDIEKNPDGVKLYMIPKKDLLAMSQPKIHIRLTRLSNKTKRKEWLYK